MAIVPFFLLFLVCFYLFKLRILPRKIGFSALKLFASMTILIFRIKIHIKKDKEYEKYNAMSKEDKFIIIYNHVSPLDCFLLKKVLHEYISFVSFDTHTQSFPVSCVSELLDIVKVCKTKKTNGTERIQKFLNTSENRLCVAPDQCRDFQEDEYIAPFKTGAFVHKNDVLPLVIRYVPSYRSEYVNWNSPKNTNVSLLTYCKNLLVDGNIDVYIKFLDLQKYNEKKFKNGKEYAEDVREKMKQELKILPKQNSGKFNKMSKQKIEKKEK